VRDDEANFVDVSGEQHFRSAGGIVPRFDPGERAAHHVVGHVIGEGRGFFSPHPSRR
jgi:hypothetical protein